MPALAPRPTPATRSESPKMPVPAIDLMDQAWWFPAVAPLPGGAPVVMLAERSLPGSLIVDQNGNRFVNEADRLHVVRAATCSSGNAPGIPSSPCGSSSTRSTATAMSLRAELFPRMRDPADLVRRRHRSPIATALAELAGMIGVPRTEFLATVRAFQRDVARRRRFRLPPRAQRVRPLLRRSHHHPEPESARPGQGPVLRGEDGAQRPRHVRGPARRRPCAGYCARTARDRRPVRDRQHRRQRVRRDVSRRGRDDRAGVGVRLHRRQGRRAR